MKKWIVALTVAGMSLSAISALVEVWSWDFNTNGNYEGWYDFSDRIGTDSVTNGVLAYSISGVSNPQWRLDVADLPFVFDVNQDYTFEITIRQTTATARAVTKLWINAVQVGSTTTLAAGDGWQTLTFDYTSGSVAMFSHLRFDPAGGQNGSWEIDSIKVYGVVPEPAAGGVLVFGALLTMMMRRWIRCR